MTRKNVKMGNFDWLWVAKSMPKCGANIQLFAPPGNVSMRRIHSNHYNLIDREGTIRVGSTPADAAITTLGLLSSIRDANSAEANPPKTTE